MLIFRSSRAPSSPMRWRDRIIVVSSIGNRCRKITSPQKCCQWEFSTQRFRISQPDKAYVCLSSCKTTCNRMGEPGCPALLHTTGQNALRRLPNRSDCPSARAHAGCLGCLRGRFPADLAAVLGVYPVGS